MKSILFIAVCLFFCPATFAQELKPTLTIKGVLIDEKTLQPIPGANVIMENANNNKGVTTDMKGSFTIPNLPAGTYTLILSSVGYTQKRLAGLVIDKSTLLDMGTIKLVESTITLNQVTVTPGSFSIMGDAPLSKQTLTEKDIKNMSWAEDITRAVARLPGISSSDYSSKFTIRGGETDEVLITLDGMELYEPFHQRDFSGGLFSIVDIQSIQGIDLMTGGFSAEYGNRLSGVFNMRTRNVQRKRFTSLGLSSMYARIYTEGTFAQNKGSYLFSARRGMLDLAFKTIGKTENLPYFYDMMGKVVYSLSTRHRLSFHVLQAGDRAKVRDIMNAVNYDMYDTRYGSSYGWLSLESTFNPNLFARTLIYSGLISHNRGGSYTKDDTSDKGTFSVADKRTYSLFGIKQDWDWQPSDKFFVKGGFEAKEIQSNYDYAKEIHDLRVDSNAQLFNYDNITNIHLNPHGKQLGIYMTGRYKLLEKLIAETGIRFDMATYTNDKVWSPRVSLVYAFSENTFLRGSWGKYYQTQFINNLDVNNGSIKFNPAKLAQHYILGFEHLFQNGINFRVESYYKPYSHLSPTWQNMRDHLEVWPEARNDNARVIPNGAASRGLEFFLKRDKGGKLTWWFSYALAKAEDDIKDIEFGGLLTKRTGKVPRLNNQQHSVHADLNYRPNDKWHFNLSGTYYVGWPRTTYTYHHTLLPDGRDFFYIEHKEFNGTIYPAYHRMDLRINRYFKTKTGNIIAFLHFINLYNHKNLKKFDLDTTDGNGNLSIDTQGNYVPTHDDKYWFGFLPVFGVSWEF